MANRGVINIVPANVLLPQDCLTENWTLVQMIGEFSYTRDVLNWLEKQKLIKKCMYGTGKLLFETYLVECGIHASIILHFLPYLYPSQSSMRFNVTAQTKKDTKTVIFITTNLIKLYLAAFKHTLKT